MYFCDKCGTKLVEDSSITAIEYNKVVKQIISDSGEVIEENLPNFITFACRGCGEYKNIDMIVVLNKLRHNALASMLKSRIEAVYKTADRTKVDEANGIAYCGICPGVIDESGYCYNDVISQCLVRKAMLDI